MKIREDVLGKCVVVALLTFLAGVPAYAVVQTSGGALLQKTLSDFKQTYSWTKPGIAHQKFHDFKRLQGEPHPTLGASRIRTAPFILAEQWGTKPSGKFMKKHHREFPEKSLKPVEEELSKDTRMDVPKSQTVQQEVRIKKQEPVAKPEELMSEDVKPVDVGLKKEAV